MLSLLDGLEMFELLDRYPEGEILLSVILDEELSELGALLLAPEALVAFARLIDKHLEQSIGEWFRVADEWIDVREWIVTHEWRSCGDGRDDLGEVLHSSVRLGVDYTRATRSRMTPIEIW